MRRPRTRIQEREEMKPSIIRVCGSVVAAGGITWGAAFLFSPSSPERNSQIEIWASAVFQLGLLALLATMWATAATGTGRWGRGILAAEAVALVLAGMWTAPYVFDADRPSTGILVVLDAFWPLSMAGLIAVGFLVMRARRWPTPTRYLPLAASLLIPVDIAVSWAPAGLRSAVTGLYLALAYGLLGLMMIRDSASLSRRAPNRPGDVQPAPGAPPLA
ncbi:hypothetical protein [Nonomuraea insulae]|uniref:Uncharacterized protein n=1 Tax=Nonomuraea insulae TaxID=1616787 RepID=A0ABW1D734_9ACTN